MRSIVPALVALTLAAPALAGPGGPGGPGGARRGGPGGAGLDPDLLFDQFDRRADRLAELLDLSSEQRAAFDQLRDHAYESARPKLDRMRTAGEALRALLDTASPDAAAVGAKVIELHRTKGELKALREGVERDLVALLDEEQKIAFETLEKARPRGPRHRFGHHGGFGPPPEG
jgi:Spy/CpxP family protein refolding chaperone